ncbi:hypothetical protein JK359_09295 [Streptomyces actinomycinicus]|uniref:Uncharacterized protein n=1 Tax=Streptomyces actinomycinicus TaxID=1695166 RepID=A0A937EHH7_9ACTN|nr:hypothetical protein [Streptomyces actinomycinicus]MBL1082175.1 hypothetical protein [Streptomyces actinomycinicus]
MPVPAVAVVAPLTGPGTAAGTVLLAEVNRIRTGTPWAADWQVFHEARGVARSVVAGDFAAVVGHTDPVVTEGALEVYRQAGLTCLLPLLPGRPPAVSWAPDDTGLARALAESALALGAAALTVVYDDAHGGAAGLTGVAGRGWSEVAGRGWSGVTGRGWSAGLVGEVVEEARAAGLAACTRAVGAGGWPSVPSPARPGVLALLAPQHRLPALLGVLGRAGGADTGSWQAVLVVADCGLPSFDALAEAAGLPVWAVHPELCLVRRTRSAVTSLTAALAEDPALRGARLAARVTSRSGLLLGGGGGVLGEGRRVSRLDAVCPVRAAAREDTPDSAPAHAL